jgi:hypothetical protein
MSNDYAALEVYRWGFAHLPGAVFYYGKELELNLEDIGFLAALFYAYEQSKPLFQKGLQIGQLMVCCPILNTQKISRKITQLGKLGLIEIQDGKSKSFADKTIFLEPLMERLQQLIIRDHPLHISNQEEINSAALEKYQQKIVQLELQLQEEKSKHTDAGINHGESAQESANYRIVADFIAKKSGSKGRARRGASA